MGEGRTGEHDAGERRAHETIRTATWTENPGTNRREVVFRRSVLLGMVLLVVAAALGLLGPRDATERARAVQGTVAVTYPQITRPGLYVQVSVELTPTRGQRRASLTLPQDALALLGVDAVQPEPTSQVSGDRTVTYEFELSDDESVTVSLNGRVPVKQGPGRTSWWVRWDGDETALTEMTTWVLP